MTLDTNAMSPALGDDGNKSCVATTDAPPDPNKLVVSVKSETSVFNKLVVFVHGGFGMILFGSACCISKTCWTTKQIRRGPNTYTKDPCISLYLCYWTAQYSYD